MVCSRTAGVLQELATRPLSALVNTCNGCLSVQTDGQWRHVRLALLIALVFTDSIHALTYCSSGLGYPVACPQPGDGPAFTKCCKYYHEPRCCLERATFVCSRSGYGSKRSGYGYDPPSDWAAVFCPQPDEPEDYTVCQWTGSQMGCYSSSNFGIIMGCIFGSVALLGIIIVVVCCVLVKTGRCECVNIRPGKYTVMSKGNAERFRQQRAAMQARVIYTNQPQVPLQMQPHQTQYGMQGAPQYGLQPMTQEQFEQYQPNSQYSDKSLP